VQKLRLPLAFNVWIGFFAMGELGGSMQSISALTYRKYFGVDLQNDAMRPDG
jgi:hypothetical protein